MSKHLRFALLSFSILIPLDQIKRKWQIILGFVFIFACARDILSAVWFQRQWFFFEIFLLRHILTKKFPRKSLSLKSNCWQGISRTCENKNKSHYYLPFAFNLVQSWYLRYIGCDINIPVHSLLQTLCNQITIFKI